MRYATPHSLIATGLHSAKCQHKGGGVSRDSCVRCVRRVDRHPRYSPEKPVDSPMEKRRNSMEPYEIRDRRRDSHDVLVAGEKCELTSIRL
jgi:hypothetical protein